MKQVIIDSDGKQCRPIYPECMFVDSTPRKGSMNPISSDAVFNVVGGATELPSYDESNEGQILKVKDDASGVEWADLPASLPDMAGQDGKILGAVDNSGTMTAQWINPPEELPTVTGNAGKILTVNAGATGVEWADAPAEIPTVTGNAGKILTVNAGATGVEWANAPAELPTVSGNANKVLTVNAGATGVEWANAPTELPTVTGNANKVLTVNAGATGVEWANAPTELPTVTGNANKVLKVNAGATGVEWATDNVGPTYTAGDGIDIDLSNKISVNHDTTLKDVAVYQSDSVGTLLSASSGKYAETPDSLDSPLYELSPVSHIKLHIPGNTFSFYGTASEGATIGFGGDEYFNTINHPKPSAVTLSVTSDNGYVWIDEQDVIIPTPVSDQYWVLPYGPTYIDISYFAFFKLSGGTAASGGMFNASSTNISIDPVVFYVPDDSSPKMLGVNLPGMTTAGISDIQLVNALPASPVSSVLYLIAET